MIDESKRKGDSVVGSFYAARSGFADVWEYYMKIIDRSNQSIQSGEINVTEEKSVDSIFKGNKDLQNSLPENIRLGKKLGSGQFGDVYSGLMTMKEGIPPRLVAVKFLQNADEAALASILDKLGLIR